MASVLASAPTSTGRRPSAEELSGALESVTNPRRVRPLLVAAGSILWTVFSLVSWLVPDNGELPMSAEGTIEAATPFTVAVGLVVAASPLALLVAASVGGGLGSAAHRALANGAPWFIGAGVWALFWELSTTKTALLSPPYFAAPQQIFSSLWSDRVLLAESLGNSLLLLAVGFVTGLVTGLVTGVLIGWYQAANYWVHPILVFIGPVPSLAWVPIVFVLFPTAYAGAVFMIALSVWFPITVLTRAGILSVPRSYFDVAQTLGARGWFLVLRVALPSALPSIFTGAFMALGSSFVSLTVAENFGVNSGLGWYLNYKKSWGDFPGLYAGIVLLVLVCGLLLTLLFRTRNHVLRWEKELTRW